MQEPSASGINKKNDHSLEATEDTPEAPLFVYCITLFAMALIAFVAGFDFTAAVAVLPEIAAKFSKLKSVNWVVTVYLLAMASFLPSVKKIARICGHRSSLVGFALLYLAGLVMSGASKELKLLLAGRGIAGVGAAGCVVISVIVVSELGSLKQRVSGLRVLLAVWLAASVLGLIAGGRLASNGSWRWAFYLNCPILLVAAAIAVCFVNVHRSKQSRLEMVKSIDVLGTLFVTGGTLTLILALNYGGDLFNWASGVVIILLVLSVVLFCLFAFVQAKFSLDPIIPFAKFSSRSSMALLFLQPFAGIATYTPILYLALWYNVVKTASLESIGNHLLAIVLTAAVVSVLCSVVIAKWKWYVPLVWLSGIFLTLGCGLLLALNKDTGSSAPIGYMIILGIGVGLSIEPHIAAMRAAAPNEDIAAVISLFLFLRFVGAVICIALFNTVMQNKLTTKLAVVVLSHPLYYKYIIMSADNHDVIRLPSVPQSVRDDVTQSNAQAFNSAFVCCLVFAAVTIPLCLFVKRPQPSNEQGLQADRSVTTSRNSSGAGTVNGNGQSA
ncbi:hypothetical protein IWW45_007657 [Coemansia sp. RSA 485]|nr:hypothetical protein IWW45_007657 [Coemansia sp. RSA 485]